MKMFKISQVCYLNRSQLHVTNYSMLPYSSAVWYSLTFKCYTKAPKTKIKELFIFCFYVLNFTCVTFRLDTIPKRSKGIKSFGWVNGIGSTVVPSLHFRFKWKFILFICSNNWVLNTWHLYYLQNKKQINKTTSYLNFCWISIENRVVDCGTLVLSRLIWKQFKWC